MDTIPKFVAGIFLFRTLKSPANRIAENIRESPSSLLVLSFFLLGELGIPGLFKLLPVFIYIHSQYHSLPIWKKYPFSDIKQYLNQLRNINQFTLLLTPVISSTAFLTGWFVRDPNTISSLPVNTFLFNLLGYPIWIVFICSLICYFLKNNKQNYSYISANLYLSIYFS